MADSKKVKKATSTKKVVDINDPEFDELRKRYENTQKEIEKTEKEIKRLEQERALQSKDKIQLAELLLMAAKFINEEITPEEMDAFGKKLTIKPYLPMMEKYRLLSLLVFEMNDMAETNELGVLKAQKALFFDVLLGGYGMVDVTENVDGPKLKTYSNMDILYPIYGPFILQYCGRDYDNFTNMFEMMININHMDDLVNIMSSVDYKVIKEETEKNRMLVQSLEENKELIKDLKDIAVAVNPVNEIVNKAMQVQAVKDLEDKKEVKKTKKVTKKVTKKITSNSNSKSTGKKSQAKSDELNKDE